MAQGWGGLNTSGWLVGGKPFKPVRPYRPPTRNPVPGQVASKHPTGGPRSQITFYGQDFFDASKNYTFSVLAGDTAPTIIGGYANWQVIKRPLRRSLTMFQDYDPISMEVSVRFIKLDNTGWRTDDATGLAIEKEIQLLEWMAGEGIFQGPSPKVWLSTFDGGGNTIPLIPFEYQAAAGPVATAFSSGDVTPWIVTGLVWDKSPVRNANMRRVKQDATVTVQYYQAPGGAPATTGKARAKATTVTARAGKDTALQIARHEPTSDPATLATLIRQAPQNKALHLRSVHQKIKHGKKVYVPAGN